VAVVPARVRTPKDKAIVERTIQCFQRWFYFKVRHRTFTSLVELNQCLREHLVLFHAKNHRILRRTRQDLFESEKPSLQPLPHFPFVVSTHRKAKPYADCHLVFEKAYYSVPYQLRGHELDVWATDKTVEICQNGTRVAFHGRARSDGQFVTDSNHYPPEHQAYAETTPNEVRSYADKIGPETSALVQRLLSGSAPLKHLRRSQGIVGLAKKYGRENLEKAAKKANLFNQSSIYFLENILKRGRLESDVDRNRQIKRDANPLLRGEELFH
jgi:hypothetical protein